MKFSDGYETINTIDGIAIYFENEYLETTISPRQANIIMGADKANRETIRYHREIKLNKEK